MSSGELHYHRIFQPSERTTQPSSEPSETGFGDRRELTPYVYSEAITLAINVALATARPLLVRGPAGSGKSSLAADVARQKGWDFHVEVVSSRTRGRDLLWDFDAVQRLRDAQAGLQVDDASRYVRPGVLWRAFDPRGAAGYADKLSTEPSAGAVVLLDEIDKAEPDTPNDLLVPLGSGSFYVTDLKLDVRHQRDERPLIIITTNEERELARAFVRRCVVLQLPAPDREWLVKVAEAHFGTDHKSLYNDVAEYVIRIGRQAEDAGLPPPSTAEYLDALAACQRLDAEVGGRTWDHIATSTLAKWIRLPHEERS